MSLEITIAAAAVPVTTAEYKDHLRVDLSDDDTLIAGLGAGAVEYTEQTTSRTLVSTTYKLTENAIVNGRIELPRSDVTSITSVTLIDDTGSSNVVASSVYELDSTGVRHFVVTSAGEDWPTYDMQASGGVEVVFVAGYTDAAAVPDALTLALKLLVGHLYEFREPYITGTIIASVPLSYEALVEPYTVARIF